MSSYHWQGEYTYDYNLGYVRSNCSLPGIELIGSDTDVRILTLGGSGRTWAQTLADRIQDSGYDVQIANGDTNGYVSGQELLMLIRDGLLLAPKHVATFSGETNFLQHIGFDCNGVRLPETAKDHPFVGARQAAIVSDVIQTLGILYQDIFLGMPDSTPPGRLWLTHMTVMHDLCAEFGIGFTAFLQPSLFGKKNAFEPFEMEYFTVHMGIPESELHTFNAAIMDIYRETISLMQDIDWIVDLSSILDELGEANHPLLNDNGYNELVAGKMLPYLEAACFRPGEDAMKEMK